MDPSDQEGASNGEFSDLKASETLTSLVLLDGTRVTFTARDNGVIEAVDVVKGTDHIHGLGIGSTSWDEEHSYFLDPANNPESSLPDKGDVVYAGGDGNDWFTAAGQMIWGATTSAPVRSRPSFVYELEASQTVEEFHFSQTVETQA